MHLCTWSLVQLCTCALVQLCRRWLLICSSWEIDFLPVQREAWRSLSGLEGALLAEYQAMLMMRATWLAVADILKELISFKQIGLPGEGDRNREWIFTAGWIDSHCYQPRAIIYCAMDSTKVIIPSISSGMTLTRNVQKHERSSKISGGKAKSQSSDTEGFLIAHCCAIFLCCLGCEI